MRAICESCARPQPTDWQPGDLCIHCGQAAREQTRCYWCAHWVPVGNFCRGCGAEGILIDQYAPARMLKYYGSDMFSIPKMLREMDPARIDTFRAIYARHQAVALRHIEDLRELETELFSNHWSSELEELLIPQLPWPEDKLALYSAPENSGRNSPFGTVSTLAALVALRRGEFELLPHYGASLLSSSTPWEMRLEAALQLANWRVSGNTYLEGLRYAVMDVLRLAPEPKPPLVLLSQVYVGEKDVEVPVDAIHADDVEVSFFAALLQGQEQVLTRALESRNPLQQNVAARKLISMHRAGSSVAELLASDDQERLKSLLDHITYVKHPVRELHAALFETIRRYPKTRLARSAATAICLGCTHEEAMRLARIGDWDILHSLSLAKLQPETFREIGELLVRNDRVVSGQFAWLCFAAAGRMPQDFVERVFHDASPSAQKELVLFAEKQLDDLPGRPLGTSMERVLIKAAFGDHSPDVITTAWAAMHRINYHRDYGSTSPFPYSVENITKYWPYHEFEQRLAKLQANKEAMSGTFVAEELRRFLGSRA